MPIIDNRLELNQPEVLSFDECKNLKAIAEYFQKVFYKNYYFLRFSNKIRSRKCRGTKENSIY